MKIVTSGQTRVVLFIGPLAIKIARLGIWYCLRRTLEFYRSDRKREKIAQWRLERGGVVRVVIQALLSGFVANVNEGRCWRRWRDPDLAETLFSLAIVNVQWRGSSVLSSEIESLAIVNALRAGSANRGLIVETTRVNQFRRIHGRIQLVDYGNPALQRFLRRHHSRMQPVENFRSRANAIVDGA